MKCKNVVSWMRDLSFDIKNISEWGIQERVFNNSHHGGTWRAIGAWAGYHMVYNIKWSNIWGFFNASTLQKPFLNLQFFWSITEFLPLKTSSLSLFTFWHVDGPTIKFISWLITTKIKNKNLWSLALHFESLMDI